MVFDFFDIVRNLTQTHSKELMEAQMADENFDGVWNTYMVLRYLSLSKNYKAVLESQSAFEDMPGSVLYPVLLRICRDEGGTASQIQYLKSPFSK